MRNNETGEFELVVGNRQLLSGFFIVVLLFAVAFAMGYVVGQNSPKSARMASDSGSSIAPATAGGELRPQAAAPAAPVVTAPPTPVENTPTEQAADTGPQPTTQAAQATPPAPTPTPTPVAERIPEPPANPGIVAASSLPPGSFWQVMAVKTEVAEAMRQALKTKGFQVSLTPGSSNLTRVLVGPFVDTAALSRAKTELEGAGFHPVRYKRD
jgi:cell division protein FtsN